MANRQNQSIQATEPNQNTKQDSQQSEVNPVAVLLEWSDRKSMYALSSLPLLAFWEEWFLTLPQATWWLVSLMEFKNGRFTCIGDL